jgi:hypothetical protein
MNPEYEQQERNNKFHHSFFIMKDTQQRDENLTGILKGHTPATLKPET